MFLLSCFLVLCVEVEERLVVDAYSVDFFHGADDGLAECLQVEVGVVLHAAVECREKGHGKLHDFLVHQG